MLYRFFVALCLVASLNCGADAGRTPSIPFVDGAWHGDIAAGPDGTGFDACWASTTFEDGTTLRLARRKDGQWSLQLSNPVWHFPVSQRYTMVTLVDFYPRLHIAVEAKSPTVLEIADIDGISLLGQIEIGHTIDLASDGFNAKYDLEGSAKIIQRIRNCFADHSHIQ